MNEAAKAIIKLRWVIILFFIAVSILFALQIPKAEIDPSVKSMLPDDIASRITLDKIEDIFGGTEMGMIIIQTEDVLEEKTLKRVKEISKKVKRIKGVDQVLSLFEAKDIKGENGAMVVDPAVKKIPKNKEQREELRSRLEGNDMVYGSIVAEDFTATAVIALVKSDINDSYFTGELRRIAGEIPGSEEVLFGGLPFIRVQLSHNIRTDLARLLPIGILIMLVFLFVCFRQLRGVFLPFAVVMMSIAVGMGIIPVFGWKIHMITILVPIMMIAIANDYGIHLVNEYQQENIENSSLTKKELARRIFLRLGKPVIMTGITTIAGMLCLLSHIIIPAKRVGIQASLGIFFALAASLLFITAVLSVLPKAKPLKRKNKNKGRLMERMLQGIATFVSGKPKVILFVSFVVIIGVGAGAFSITVDTNPINFYDEDHPIVKASRAVNDNFGGSWTVSVVAEGDIKDPAVLNQIDKLEKELKEMPDIGNTTSIARVVRQMSKALNDRDEPGYNSIPETRNAVAQYFELYSMSSDPEDFEKLVDFPYEHSHIIGRINDQSSEVIKKVYEKVIKKTENKKIFTHVGGFAAIFSELVEKVVVGQLLSLFLSLVLIGILVAILFRSVVAGFTAVIPLFLALAMLFGLMGYAGIELSMITAMLSSIMVGVGIDYTIHFLWRYREERKRGLNPPEAVKKTLNSVGRGIVFNALSVVIGFAVLFISAFLPIQFFAFLVVVSISTCLISALVLLPAVCIIFRPKYLEPEKAVKS